MARTKKQTTEPTDAETTAPVITNTDIVKEIVAAELAPKPVKPPCVCASCVQQRAVMPGQIIR